MSTPGIPVSREEKLRRGSCLCKTVRYEISGEPFGFRVCHCVNCRKATGSAFMANVFFPVQKFRLIAGHDTLRTYLDTETASGAPIKRLFCGTCGANVYMQSTAKGGERLVVVQTGCVDEDGDGVEAAAARTGGGAPSPAIGNGGGGLPWRPDNELFVEQRRGWVERIEVVPRPRRKKKDSESSLAESRSKL